ncbi:MAG TPA: S41 family peptidase [Hanamia sp.]|nr:S41 family peptidase [Hanamia sp.]
MKKYSLNYLYLYLFIIVLAGSVSSCKKSKGDSGGGTGGTTGTTQLSDADSLKYLMYNIMQVSFNEGGRDTATDLPTYYWYNQVPKLNPLSPAYDSADVLLAQMKNYAINPSTGNPYDRYSFLDKTGAVAAEIQQGVGGDLGMQVTYARDSANKTYLYVLFADKNSPAGKVGVTRGWQITAINGDTDISYDGSNGPNVNKVINAVYYDPSSSFTFLKPDKTTVTYTLAQATYDINPVLFDTVYSVGGKSVGYFVFNTFSNVTYNGAPTLTETELNRVFSKFESANISSLIVDLRYNGGGSVATAEYIDSLVAPSSVKGKVMYNYLYNDKLTALIHQQPDFLQTQVLFNGGGSLNLSHVFFIGTGNTASASELTINNLKPYLDVKLVGDTTYGKPVGFFSFTISDFPNGVEKDLADLYAINFETRNANNQGGYFNGLIPDEAAYDYVNVPWGNPNDDNLSKIFSYISTGTFPRISFQARMAADKSLRLSIPSTIHPLRFNGMVDYKISNQMKGIINKSLRRSH